MFPANFLTLLFQERFIVYSEEKRNNDDDDVRYDICEFSTTVLPSDGTRRNNIDDMLCCRE